MTVIRVPIPYMSTSLDHSIMDSPGYNRLHPQSTDDDFNIEFANIYLTIDEP